MCIGSMHSRLIASERVQDALTMQFKPFTLIKTSTDEPALLASFFHPGIPAAIGHEASYDAGMVPA